eukprot:gene8879-225_t
MAVRPLLSEPPVPYPARPARSTALRALAASSSLPSRVGTIPFPVVELVVSACGTALAAVGRKQLALIPLSFSSSSQAVLPPATSMKHSSGILQCAFFPHSYRTLVLLDDAENLVLVHWDRDLQTLTSVLTLPVQHTYGAPACAFAFPRTDLGEQGWAACTALVLYVNGMVCPVGPLPNLWAPTPSPESLVLVSEADMDDPDAVTLARRKQAVQDYLLDLECAKNEQDMARLKERIRLCPPCSTDRGPAAPKPLRVQRSAACDLACMPGPERGSQTICISYTDGTVCLYLCESLFVPDFVSQSIPLNLLLFKCPVHSPCQFVPVNLVPKSPATITLTPDPTGSFLYVCGPMPGLMAVMIRWQEQVGQVGPTDLPSVTVHHLSDSPAPDFAEPNTLYAPGRDSDTRPCGYARLTNQVVPTMLFGLHTVVSPARLPSRPVVLPILQGTPHICLPATSSGPSVQLPALPVKLVPQVSANAANIQEQTMHLLRLLEQCPDSFQDSEVMSQLIGFLRDQSDAAIKCVDGVAAVHEQTDKTATSLTKLVAKLYHLLIQDGQANDLDAPHTWRSSSEELPEAKPIQRSA